MGKPLRSVFTPTPGIESSLLACIGAFSARVSMTVLYGVEEAFVNRVSIVSRE